MIDPELRGSRLGAVHERIASAQAARRSALRVQDRWIAIAVISVFVGLSLVGQSLFAPIADGQRWYGSIIGVALAGFGVGAWRLGSRAGERATNALGEFREQSPTVRRIMLDDDGNDVDTPDTVYDVITFLDAAARDTSRPAQREALDLLWRYVGLIWEVDKEMRELRERGDDVGDGDTAESARVDDMFEQITKIEESFNARVAEVFG
ncbi:hypothetical protein AB1046_07730 [Promicromonospora sp. Populi]|uniref:hypothetical protein n=1 Tax=Promicromonospora sp. Populi TaxID=3239420 RepID=UPI0034E21D16